MASTNAASKIRDSVHLSLTLFVKDLRDRQGRKRRLTVRSWSTVKDVKDQLQQFLHVPPSAQRLYFGPLLETGKELPNRRSLHDVGIYRNGETLLLDIISGTGHIGQHDLSHDSVTTLRRDVHDMCISSSMLSSTPKALRRIVQQTRRGLVLGLKPVLVLDGSGGTYFLHDARKVKVAVFKPADEEPYAVNNPRGYVPQSNTLSSLREGILPGEACLREVAAFLLDHSNSVPGFSDVPMTTLAEARHPAFNTNGARLKLSEGGAAMGSHAIAGLHTGASSNDPKKVGSCQEFVYAEDTMDDLSPSKLSVDQVHKIVILDLRIMNADRNSANLLVRRKTDNSLELVPIDHGYCLRSVCDVSWFDWCWLDWPQLKKPMSNRSRDYILNLDIEADVRLLQESLNIGKEALEYLRTSTKILQAGVKAGLTLYEIASMCCRNDNAGVVPSKLEILTKQASELTTLAIENERWGHVAASKALAEQLSPEPMHCSNDPISKSVSLANFSSFASNGSSHKSNSNNGNGVPYVGPSFDFGTVEEAPPSRQAASDSTGSDNSEEQQEEECEEWAAGVVAVNLDLNTSNYKARSESMGSTSSESTSEGFWHVRPGDNERIDCSSPMSWTHSPMSSRVNDDAGGLVEPPPTLPPPPLNFVNNNHHNSSSKERKPSSPSAVDTSAMLTTPPPPVLPTARGLTRSKSYSAFTFRTLGNDISRLTKSPLQTRGNSAETEQSRQYFLKFIDLLIEREMVASGRRRGLSDTLS